MLSGLYAQEKNTPDNWSAFNRTYDSHRYSPLEEINKQNVAQLQLLHTFELGADSCNFQTGPLVIDGTMFFTSDTITYAIDAGNGQLKWQHKRLADNSAQGKVNRGVAYCDGKLIRGTSDAKVMALDAACGQKLWEVQLDITGTPGAYIPMSPIAWNGLVFIGNAAGDYVGVVGHVYALDIHDGHLVWEFDVIPESGPIRDEWTAEAKGIIPTGGCFWSSFSLDEENGILYVPAGNPAPDLDVEVREGRNLYTNCVLALNASTGELLAYNQVVKNDSHDWDVVSTPVLLTTSTGRKMVASANKDGLLTLLDRTQVSATDVQPETDMPFVYALPITVRENGDAPLSREIFTYFKPGFGGAIGWNGPAYHPETGVMYTAATDWGSAAQLYTLEQAYEVPAPGALWAGGYVVADDPSMARGWVYAYKIEDGSLLWKYQAPAAMRSGITVTKGGLVFCGTTLGDMYAFDADSGQLLWQDQTGVSLGGGVISYRVAGKQYLAVAGGYQGSLSTGIPKVSKILIYGLQ